jgi:hypothetical protein
VLTSCWIPENFDTKIAINKDGSYTFTYDGTLTFGMALAAAQKGGLSASDEAEFRKEGEKLRREPGFKKVDYQGKGRYKVLFEKAGNRGEPFYFRLVRRNRGYILVRAVCQVSDRGPFPVRGRCENRRIFSW